MCYSFCIFLSPWPWFIFSLHVGGGVVFFCRFAWGGLFAFFWSGPGIVCVFLPLVCLVFCCVYFRAVFIGIRVCVGVVVRGSGGVFVCFGLFCLFWRVWCLVVLFFSAFTWSIGRWCYLVISARKLDKLFTIFVRVIWRFHTGIFSKLKVALIDEKSKFWIFSAASIYSIWKLRLPPHAVYNPFGPEQWMLPFDRVELDPSDQKHWWMGGLLYVVWGVWFGH